MERIYNWIRNKLSVIDWEYYAPLIITYVFPIIFLYAQYEINRNNGAVTEVKFIVDSLVQTTIAYLISCAWKYINNSPRNMKNRYFLVSLGVMFICYLLIYGIAMAYNSSCRILVIIIIKTLLLLVINYFSYFEWKEIDRTSDDSHRKLSA